MRTILAALLLLSAPAFAARYTVMEHWNTPMVPNAYGEPTDSLGVGMDGNYCVGYSGATENLSTGAYALTDPGGHTSFTARVPPNTARTGCGWAASEWSTRQGWPGNGTTPYGPSPYGYGYYETRMRPTCTQGVSASFFWVQAPNYGPLELDVEFPNNPGHTFSDVHWTIHPAGQTIDYQLGFNPCQAAHRYGFLWTPGEVQFTVDGAVKYTMTDPSLVSTATGYVMGNTMAGITNWGGGPGSVPNQAEADTVYLWWGYQAGATSVPGK